MQKNILSIALLPTDSQPFLFPTHYFFDVRLACNVPASTVSQMVGNDYERILGGTSSSSSSTAFTAALSTPAPAQVINMPQQQQVYLDPYSSLGNNRGK